MAMVKPSVFPLFVCLLIALCGCQQKKKVAIDPELQKQLDEFERKLDEDEISYIRNGGAKVLTASTDDEAPPNSDQTSSAKITLNASTTQPPENGEDDANSLRASSASGFDFAQSGTESARNMDQDSSHSTASLNVGSVQSTVIVNSEKPATELKSPAYDPSRPAESIDQNSSPNQVCTAFLQLLDNGDHSTASKFLTNIAQLETARANLILEAPGGPGCRTEMKPAQFATAEKKVAQVECWLHQPGIEQPVILTWIMRYQYNGWKISGMTIRMDQQATPDLLSFENPVDLARIQQTVEPDPTIEFHPSEGIREMTASGASEGLKR